MNASKPTPVSVSASVATDEAMKKKQPVNHMYALCIFVNVRIITFFIGRMGFPFRTPSTSVKPLGRAGMKRVSLVTL